LDLRIHLLALAWAALLTTAPAVAGAGGGRSILVLDASGSMWGRLQDRTKIELAREAVDGMLESWPETEPLGLIAYGHRRKGDCADIEVLQPASAFDAGALRAHVHALQPKGMTPISASVKHAAEQLRYTEQKATVILVSDGEETCDADPCALGAELERLGIEFTAHVIGFDLPEGKARTQLQCLAGSTGGRYLEARSAAELGEALDKLAGPPAAAAKKVDTAAQWMPGFALEWDADSTIDGESDNGGTRALDFTGERTAKDCQALCMDDDSCVGWHYEPAGSYFVEHPRCHLKGRSAAMRLRQEGQGWVAGVKPGVKLIAVEAPVP
jgi:hypothetical protein